MRVESRKTSCSETTYRAPRALFQSSFTVREETITSWRSTGSKNKGKKFNKVHDQKIPNIDVGRKEKILVNL